MTVVKGLALEELRKRLAQAERPREAPLPTGSAPVDALLQGGLPRGRVTEVAGAWSSGKTALLFGAMAELTRARRLCAYIDGRGELYPPSAAALGVDLERLLVVRPPGKGLVRAAEIVAKSGAFALAVVDLPDGERLDDAASGRLRAAAAGGGAAVVVLSPVPGAVAQASVKLQVADRTFHTGQPAPAAERLVVRGRR
jgi:recombination protein RecA